MHSKHLEYIHGQWCVVDDITKEEKGMKTVPASAEEPEEPEQEEHFGPRIFLDNFTLNTDDRKVYPYNIIYPMGLRQLDFAPITILYGNNGSGKSTLLNVIAEKIGVKKKTAGNSNAYFSDFAENCNFQCAAFGHIPEDSVFVRSEDIMDGITKGRRRYASMKKAVMDEARKLPNVGEDSAKLNNLLNHPDALTSSDRFYLSRCRDSECAYEADNIADSFESNGEVALKKMQEVIMPDSLYFFDEPEVSLSPVFQRQLAGMISLFAEKLRAQFVIATHSPFFLSLEGARIYDLDSRPVKICNWYELPNMKAYFSLFEEKREQFLKK